MTVCILFKMASRGGKKKGGGRGKKRAAVEQQEEEDGTSASTALSVDSPVASSSIAEEKAKRVKVVSNISKHLLCPITQELMVDPVLAEDGRTYERLAIVKWLATKSTSPLDPSCSIDASQLRPNRAVKEAIEELVESGELDDEVCADYMRRKEALSLEHAQELYDEGKVEEAAELGLPEAQGDMAERYQWGKDGVTKDLVKCVEWAKKAAAGGDLGGQFHLGFAYDKGEGGLEKDYVLALKWYKKAAEQGDVDSMVNIGLLYKTGGHGVTKNKATAVSWFRKSAAAGDAGGQYNLGRCYYTGEGVTVNLKTARRWFKKSADQGDANALCAMGTMLVYSEGGERDVKGAIALWEESAAKDSEDDDEDGSDAQYNLDMLHNALSDVDFML